MECEGIFLIDIIWYYFAMENMEIGEDQPWDGMEINGDPNFEMTWNPISIAGTEVVGHWGRGALRPLQRGQDDGLSSIQQLQRGTCRRKSAGNTGNTYEYRSC